MTGIVRSRSIAGRGQAGGRRVPAGRPAPRRAAPSGPLSVTPRSRPGRALFFAEMTQQVTSILRERVLCADLVAAGVTLGALALWGLALHLLAS